MEKLNNYTAPEIVVIELEQDDVIATSVGATDVIPGEGW